jgi:hypothetical protein
VILAVERPVTWRPMRRASRSTTDRPASLSRYAAVTPTIPAPTMATSAACAPASGAYAVSGAVAVQQQSGLPESPEAWSQSGRIANSSVRRARRATQSCLPGSAPTINVPGLFLCLGYREQGFARTRRRIGKKKGPEVGPFHQRLLDTRVSRHRRCTGPTNRGYRLPEHAAAATSNHRHRRRCRDRRSRPTRHCEIPDGDCHVFHRDRDHDLPCAACRYRLCRSSSHGGLSLRRHWHSGRRLSVWDLRPCRRF